MTTPVTAAPPGALNVNVVVPIVAGFIATLKVAEIARLMGTPLAPLTGTVEITVGGVGAGSVRKLHTYLLANPVPAESWAPVPMVAVYSVLTVSKASGVNVATLPEQPTVPGTGVAPGPLTVNVAAGDASVEHFIISLNVALSTRLRGTPVAPLTGIVDITAGVGEIVVKGQT